VETPLPQYLERNTDVNDTDSFVKYLARFRANPIIEAHVESRQITATLDFHENAQDLGFSAHTLTRKYKLTRRFERWTGANNKKMLQVDFARFLEDAMQDVAEPTHGELMKLVLQFKAFRNGQMQSAIDLQNGDVDFKFVNATKTETGSALLPETITIRLPVFRGEDREWELTARLRYQVSDDKPLTLWVELIRLDDLLDDAFTQAVSDLKEALPSEDADTVIIRP
jgi:uncharacterized protein YfdQ (DUF2303 family)